MINILCDTALAMACVAARKKVSPYMLMRAAGGLLLEQGTEAAKIGALGSWITEDESSALDDQSKALGNKRYRNKIERSA